MPVQNKNKNKNNVNNLNKNDIFSNSSNKNSSNSNIENNSDSYKYGIDSSDCPDINDADTFSHASKFDTPNKNTSKNESDDEIDIEAQQEYVQNVVLDRVIKYIKIDDLIKKKNDEHRKNMKIIKNSKDKLEDFLINYLSKINEEYFIIGNTDILSKIKTEKKSPPKMEDISMALVDGFKKHEIYDNDDDIKRIVKDFLETIEAKREIKTKTYLKREKKKDNANTKKKINAVKK